MQVLLAMLPKVLMSLGMRLLSEKLLEELLIWLLEKLAASSKTKVDDELLEMVKKALAEKK